MRQVEGYMYNCIPDMYGQMAYVCVRVCILCVCIQKVEREREREYVGVFVYVCVREIGYEMGYVLSLG